MCALSLEVGEGRIGYARKLSNNKEACIAEHLHVDSSVHVENSVLKVDSTI